jgi:hypothetical protein
MNTERRSFNRGRLASTALISKGTHAMEAAMRREYHNDEYDIMLLRWGQVIYHFWVD